MVHNDDAAKLYVPGEMASMPLAILAEDGDPGKSFLNVLYASLTSRLSELRLSRFDPQLPYSMLSVSFFPSGPLVDFYMGAEGVKSVMSFMDGAPFKGGDTLEIVVEVSKDFPLVTIASMAINTNDCFVAMNGVQIFKGMVGVFDGLDSGSEENNELCSSIPGPGCAMESGNVQSGNGEGFVHVHRGMQDVNPEELPSFEYDWRNPMMRVEVM